MWELPIPSRPPPPLPPIHTAALIYNKNKFGGTRCGTAITFCCNEAISTTTTTTTTTTTYHRRHHLNDWLGLLIAFSPANYNSYLAGVQEWRDTKELAACLTWNLQTGANQGGHSLHLLSTRAVNDDGWAGRKALALKQIHQRLGRGTTATSLSLSPRQSELLNNTSLGQQSHADQWNRSVTD